MVSFIVDVLPAMSTGLKGYRAFKSRKVGPKDHKADSCQGQVFLSVGEERSRGARKPHLHSRYCSGYQKTA